MGWVLDTYQARRSEERTDHPWVTDFERETKVQLGHLDLHNGMHLKPASGQGSWAEVPWIGLRHDDLAENFNSGAYIALLFHADGSGASLSLQQGITVVRKAFGSLGGARRELGRRAGMIRSGIVAPGKFSATDAAIGGHDRRARLYRVAHVCGRSYRREEFGDVLADVEELARFYLELCIDDVVRGIVGAGEPVGPRLNQGDFEKRFRKPISDLELSAMDLSRSALSGTRTKQTVVQQRIGQAALLRALMRVYKPGCAACGETVFVEQRRKRTYRLQAAHAVPVALGGATIVRNALLLCLHCHWGFDRLCWWIGEEGIITVAEPLRRDYRIHGQRLATPKVPEATIDPEAVEHHRRRALERWGQ